jgi:hypothetical protein
MKRKFTQGRDNKSQKRISVFNPFLSSPFDVIKHILYYVRRYPAVYYVCRLLRKLITEVWIKDCPSWNFELYKDAPILIHNCYHAVRFSIPERRLLEHVVCNAVDQTIGKKWFIKITDRNKIMIFGTSFVKITLFEHELTLSSANLFVNGSRYLVTNYPENSFFETIYQQKDRIRLDGKYLFLEALEQKNLKPCKNVAVDFKVTMGKSIVKEFLRFLRREYSFTLLMIFTPDGLECGEFCKRLDSNNVKEPRSGTIIKSIVRKYFAFFAKLNCNVDITCENNHLCFSGEKDGLKTVFRTLICELKWNLK